MVQHLGIPTPQQQQQREFFTTTSSRETSAWTDRSLERSYDPAFNDASRFNSNTTSVHPRHLSVEHALKRCVGIQGVREFGVFILCENGDEKTYTSQTLTPYQQDIFTSRFRETFRSVVRKATAEGANTHPGIGTHFHEIPIIADEVCLAFDHDSMFQDFQEPNGRNHRKHSTTSDESSSGSRRRRVQRHIQEESDGDDSISIHRKRQRGKYRQDDDEDDDRPTPVQSIKTQSLRLDDEEEVRKFYMTRFKDMQQAACKVIGKAFVKLVEPKKQTHFPYTKGEDKRPPWWPATVGELKVRHREPDHLLKAERINLLIHILVMIIENKCEAVQKANLSVKKLEEVTMEAMSNWFNDTDHPANSKKRPFLREIFKVARLQERWKRGELDPNSRCSVMTHDGSMNGSDDEPEEGDEYDEADAAVLAAAAEMSTPDSLVSSNHTLMQNIQSTRPMEDNRVKGESSQTWRQLPVRGYPQPQGFSEHKMEDAQQSSFPNDSFRNKWELHATPNFQQPTPDPGHHTQYQSPPQHPMYGWQSSNMPVLNTSSNGPSPQPYYTTSPHTTSTGGYQLPPPLPLAQPMLPPLALSHPGYDGMGTRYDTGPANMGPQMRTGSLAHPYTGRGHEGGYQDFLNDGSMPQYGHGEEQLKEESHGMHTQ
ncbi:hypothetical protein BP5796_06323 [Coleophoma crateriformis]|uniref:Subtelomeric hrmA-associated cluster protein AFUB-079030/YDR124W-like helical bundle domain-containing protein n=1 Tax=Coleophoma crateriformis TaxID=565419 RepID=A0A3D8RXD4_9HELO|nr:hypothetical protein BP5796_06323 [Coleophoma crateriformis]